MENMSFLKVVCLSMLTACLVLFSGCAVPAQDVSVYILDTKEEPIEMPLIKKNPLYEKFNVSYTVNNLGNNVGNCHVKISMYYKSNGFHVESIERTHWFLSGNESIDDFVIFEQPSGIKYSYSAEVI